MTIDTTTFTNSGTLAISNGDAVTIEPTNFSNTGSITLASGASLYFSNHLHARRIGKTDQFGWHGLH